MSASDFRGLHQSGCFLIPNPWDIGSARFLASLGFPALATTSGGFAFSRGLPDNSVSRDAMLTHIAEIVRASPLPVNADFQSGFGATPEQVADSVQLCTATGVAGLSIEDSDGQSLYALPDAIERLQAARSQTGVVLTARAECYLVGHPDPLRESIKRLQAYANAGADVLYAPGVCERDDIKSIVEAVSPKPVNVLMSANTGLTMQDLAALGVRRVSVGSSLARAAWAGFAHAAKLMAENGSFAGFDRLMPFTELNGFFENLHAPATE